MPCAARVRPLLAAGFGPPSAAPAAWYLTSTPRFPGSGRPRSLWSARLPGAGYPLDHSLWRANAHNQAVPPPGARASAWGREPKPCWPSGQQATLMGSVGGWPSATLPVRSSGLAAAGNRPHGRDWRAGLLLLGGVCSGVWRPSWPDLSRAADRALGNSVGAIESVVGGPVAFCATGAFGRVAALGRLPSCTVTQTFRPLRGASRCASRAPGSG